MVYINRRLVVVDELGQEAEYSDVEFFSIDAPLVVVGEPGAGKTDLANMMAERLNGIVEFAEVLEGEPPREPPDPDTILILDGLDEVLANSQTRRIGQILSRVHLSGYRRFALTCRAADWAHSSNQQFIMRRFGRAPIVGRLQPLDDKEITEIVDASSGGVGGEDFLTEAKERDVAELLRNPQMLTLLVRAVRKSGWPATKTQLFESACRELSAEQNPVHLSIQRERPSIDTILHCSGFVFAQLLLSGSRGVKYDGVGDAVFPSTADLSSEDHPNEIIRYSVSSLLFRVASSQSVEPCHRTVAEYLAARWLVSALRERLSERRLEALLYGSTGTIPTSLRGVAAWIATLDRVRTDRFVSSDPYGCLRYGDPSEFSTPQVGHLLRELQRLAEFDPYFRSEDWGVSFGRGLARPELKSDILELIRNADTPDQLASVVLESLRGTELASEIVDDLLVIVLDEGASRAARHAAYEALLSSRHQLDWNEICIRLRKNHAVESLLVALEIARRKIDQFAGSEVAEMLVEFERISATGEGPRYAGVGYGLERHLSEAQLKDVVALFTDALPTDPDNYSAGDEGIETLLLQYLQTYLSKQRQPDASYVWLSLSRLQGCSYRQNAWNSFSSAYFAERPELRRSIQEIAFQTARSADEHWSIAHRLHEVSNGLWMREEDFIYHMNELVMDESRIGDWVERWRNLVRRAQMHRDFTGEVMSVADKHATLFPELNDVLKQLRAPSDSGWEREYQKSESRRLQRSLARARERHDSFSALMGDIQAGILLGAIEQIAMAYLGRYFDLDREGEPQQRVEELVGSENVEAALDGIIAACEHSEIPSPNECAVLRSEENRRYCLEAICLARCALQQASGNDLDGLPRPVLLAALAGCQWGVSWGDKISEPLQEELEELIFSAKSEKEEFVRGTIEPLLAKGGKHIDGLYQVTHEDRFVDIIAGLALEWLEKFENLSTQSVSYLLHASILYSPRVPFVTLIREMLSRDEWIDDSLRKVWISAAFVVDFEYSEATLRSFANEDSAHLWSFAALAFPERRRGEDEFALNASQLGFLIEEFAVDWPAVAPPTSGWRGETPYEATRLVESCITRIGSDTSDEASQILASLLDNKKLGNYSDYGRHVYAVQARSRAELGWSRHNLVDVQSVFASSAPSNIDDLQAIVFDELELLQRRLRDGPTNSVLPFWNNDKPHGENYCRDRIVEHLEPQLARYGVRVHIEGTMPDNQRCDFLNSFQEIDIPVEIKGQWHRNVWDAACNQLEDNYARSYRSSGRGIYLVLWFGRVPKFNPPRLGGRAVPKNANEMSELVYKLSPRPVSGKTRIYIMDVSRPS